MAKDPVVDSLQNLKGQLPTPRLNLSETEKDALVAAVGGPRTAQSIVKARQELPLARIPFVFSSLNTQHVVDILANDMVAAIARALKC